MQGDNTKLRCIIRRDIYKGCYKGVIRVLARRKIHLAVPELRTALKHLSRMTGHLYTHTSHAHNTTPTRIQKYIYFADTNTSCSGKHLHGHMSRGLGLGLPYHELRLPRSAGAPGTMDDGPMIRLQVLIRGAVAQLSFGLILNVKGRNQVEPWLAPDDKW